jgi:hypothetical protein
MTLKDEENGFTLAGEWNRANPATFQTFFPQTGILHITRFLTVARRGKSCGRYEMQIAALSARLVSVVSFPVLKKLG